MAGLRTASLPPFSDAHGRAITYLRLSVTDRCNLHCAYCRPAGAGACPAPRPREELLSFAELARVVALCAAAGVRKVRLTGGEPLLRRDLPQLCACLAEVPGLETLGLTTNGLLLPALLPALARAGLSRLNVSLDTLDRERFARWTGADRLPQLLAAIDQAAAEPGLTLRLNCVLQRGLNDDQLADLVEFAARRGAAIRFIEAMPLGAGPWDRRAFLPAARARRELGRRFDLRPAPASGGEAVVADAAGAAGVGGAAGEPRGPAVEFVRADTGTAVGFLPAVTGEICRRCNRFRLLADGAVKPCLAAAAGPSLRPLLRAGADDATILAALRGALARKQSTGARAGWLARQRRPGASGDPVTAGAAPGAGGGAPGGSRPGPTASGPEPMAAIGG